MPRKMTFRGLLTALTVAVVSLCGGVKAIAAQKGVFSVVEASDVLSVRPHNYDHLRHTDAVPSDAAVSKERAKDGGVTPGERAVVNVALSPEAAIYTTLVAAVDPHQLNRRVVCIRPPTRGPPE